MKVGNRAFTFSEKIAEDLVMMSRPRIFSGVAAVVLWLVATVGWADTVQLGLFMEGKRIGTSKYSSVEASYEGKPAKRTSSSTEIKALLAGEPLQLNLSSSTWVSAQGTPLLMRSSLTSGNKTQRVEAKFSAKSIKVDVNNSGTKTTRTLKIPAGRRIVDDPLQLVIEGKLSQGKKQKFLVWDPTSVSLQENEVIVLGKKRTEIAGVSVDATAVEITGPTGKTTAYLSAKGDLMRVDAPMNIVMMAEATSAPTRTILASERPVDTTAKEDATPVDIATATKIVPIPAIDSPADLTKLVIKLSGQSLNGVPNDEHQTTSMDGKAWIIDVHPVKFASGRSFTLAQARKGNDQWVEPSLNVPSDEPKFIKLAKEIVGTRSTVRSVASEIRKWVFGYMRPNGTMGIVRDANDVLASREGVCRDYAILTLTLLRAAGVPAKLAAGLVSLDGDFYYHAWVEAWDGSKWIGVDSTTGRDQISAAHIKLSEGNVDKAFTFTILSKSKLEVIDSSKK